MSEQWARRWRTGRTCRGLARVGLVAALMVLAGNPAPAAPLDDKTCDTLRATQAAAANSDARHAMARGPAWAKENLKPEQLSEVLWLIELDEKIQFRCRETKEEARAKSKSRAKASQASGKSDADDKEKPAAAAAAKSGDDEAPKPQARPKRTVTKPQAKPKPDPKPKINDAYVPPPRMLGFDN